jgi:hypothetical protein
MQQSETIPFPSRVVLQREERMFDRIRSVTLVGWLPLIRLRLVTMEGGIDFRWLTEVRVLLWASSGQVCTHRFTQWQDDDPRDFVATLGAQVAGKVDGSLCCPPLGHVALVSGSSVRFFPLSAP